MDSKALRSATNRQVEMLAFASVAILLAFLLEVLPDGRVAFRFALGYPLPESCVPKMLFGVKCPGCGLTRAMIRLSRGDLAAATTEHRLALMMGFAILVQVPYRLTALRRPDRSPPGRTFAKVCAWLLIAALIGSWFVDLLHNLDSSQ